MIDTSKLLRQWLIADTTLTNLVPAEHICFPDLPQGAQPDKGEKWISFRQVGGQSETESNILKVEYQMFAWAKNGLVAREIYRALFDLMHWNGGTLRYSVKLEEGTIKNSFETTPGQDLVDPQTGWHVVDAFFEVTMHP